MRLDNSIKENIEQIIILGGAFGITPFGKGNMGNAEFNIFYDPEAAKIVMDMPLNASGKIKRSGIHSVEVVYQ